MGVQHPLVAKPLKKKAYLEIISAARKSKLHLGKEDKLAKASLGQA